MNDGLYPQVAGFASFGQNPALLQGVSHGTAFGHQIAAIVVTVAIAAAGGAAAGLLVSAVNPADQILTAAQLFDDGTFWTVRHSFPFTPLRWQQEEPPAALLVGEHARRRIAYPRRHCAAH